LTATARPERWSGTIILLHWLTGAIILALIALGWLMVYGGLGAATTFDLYQWHKSFGFVALALTAARLIARWLTSAPLAAAAPAWEKRLAAFTQGALYALTILAIFAGWFAVSASPLPVPTRLFGLVTVPNLVRPDPALFEASIFAHKVAAWSIAFLVALHVAGALKHHALDGDDVLARILPRAPGTKSGRDRNRMMT
jgi:cytochrome b561